MLGERGRRLVPNTPCGSSRMFAAMTPAKSAAAARISVSAYVRGFILGLARTGVSLRASICQGWLEFGKSPPEEKGAGESPLDLAARGLRQIAGADQHNLVDGKLVLGRDRLADRAFDFIDGNATHLRPLDLLHHNEPLLALLVQDREGGAAMPAQCRMARLNGVLEILRIVVDAANDDHVLNASGDEELARVVEKPE